MFHTPHWSGFTADLAPPCEQWHMWGAHRRCMRAKVGLTERIGPITLIAVVWNQVSGVICSLTVLQTLLLQVGVFVDENPADLERRGWQDGAACVIAHLQVCPDFVCVWGQALESRRVGVCGRLWRGVDFPCAVMVANKQTGPLLDAIYVNTYLQNFSCDFRKCVGDLVKFSAYEMIR